MKCIKLKLQLSCLLMYNGGFPGSSADESVCNAREPSSIPGWGRSHGKGIGYPLQYSWASLVAQRVKNPPAMRETWVWSLGWEDSLQEGMSTHSSILAWRIPWTEGPVGLQSMESDRRVRHDQATKHRFYDYPIFLRRNLRLRKLHNLPK